MNFQPDPKLVSSFTQEEQSALEKIYSFFDKNGDGFLEKDEIIELIKKLGFDEISEENIDDLIDFLFSLGYLNQISEELRNNKKLSFTDYLNILKQLKLTNGSLQISAFIKDMGNLKSQKENDNETNNENSEKFVYIRIINDILSNDTSCKNYFPIDPNSMDLFDKIKDGVLLCKLLNKIEEGIIDERVINKNENMNILHQTGNLRLVINSAKSIGINCTGISTDIFQNDMDVSMILNFIGEICKYYFIHNIKLKNHLELVHLLKNNEKISTLLKLSPKEILLKWFNYNLEKAGSDKRINNFSEDIKDSEKYIILLNHLNSEICNKNGLNESDIKKRAQIVISNAKLLNLQCYITPENIISGNENLNIIFVSELFNSYKNLDPPNEKQKTEINNILADKNEREEKSFRRWINSLGIKNNKGEEININNLYEEAKDGIILLKVLDKISPGIVNWKKVDKNPNNIFKQNSNCNEVIETCKKLKLNIVGIGGGNIREGKKDYILAIVFQLMKAYSFQIIGNKTEEGLVKWGNEKVEDNLKIKSLKDKSLSNSLYFIEILKSIDPNSVNSDIIIKDKNDKDSKKSNAINCISIARKLGAIAFLDWKDIVEVNNKLLLTFLASIFEVEKNNKK